MAVTSQQIEMLACDVEGCEVKAPAIDGQLPAKFESGSVQIGALDGAAAEWVACRETHIGKAVVAAKARTVAAATADTAEDANEQPGDDEPERTEEADDDGGTYDVNEAPEFASVH